MKIKDLAETTVRHVKNHRASYAYTAGAVVGIAAMCLVLKNKRFVDIDYSLARIEKEELTGLYFTAKNGSIAWLIPATEGWTPES